MNIDDQRTTDDRLNFKWPHLCNGSPDSLHVRTATILCPRVLIPHFWPFDLLWDWGHSV